jgi:hypothetical protein
MAKSLERLYRLIAVLMEEGQRRTARWSALAGPQLEVPAALAAVHGTVARTDESKRIGV